MKRAIDLWILAVCAAVVWLFSATETLLPAGQPVSLAWDANDPAQNVEFYTIYVGESRGGPYHAELDVDATPNPTATVMVPGIPGTCYYFVATASRGDEESGYSNEVFRCYEADPPVDPPPPDDPTDPPPPDDPDDPAPPPDEPDDPQEPPLDEPDDLEDSPQDDPAPLEDPPVKKKRKGGGGGGGCFITTIGG
jgi:hypothetical protein